MISIQQSQDHTHSWRLVPFSSASGPEDELQTLIEKHPEIVPWEELQLPSSLKVLGREVLTIEGKYIDHLTIDSSGHLYVLECKIAVSHELRSIIAQALEYAAQLAEITTVDELLSTVRKEPEEVGQLIGPDWDGELFWKGLERVVREADYRIILVTDYAGNSSQARVNRSTVEYLRSTTEIHLVEIAKFEGQNGDNFFVPHITAGGSSVNRTHRQIHAWKRNLFRNVTGGPDLQVALLDYIDWIQSENPKGTRITPKGTLSSTFQGHYVAYLEPQIVDEKTTYAIWVGLDVPNSLDANLKEEWKLVIQKYEGKLGESIGGKYFLLDSETSPLTVRNHHEMQKKFLAILRQVGPQEADNDT